MLGYTSEVVNGTLFNAAPAAAYKPLVFGQSYTGPGRWPRQGVYSVPPVLPSGALQSSMAPPAYGGSMNGNMPTATDEMGNPFHLTKSPLWWGLGFLLVGMLLLMYVHFR